MSTDAELKAKVALSILNERLTALYEADQVKPTFTPILTLGKDMVDRLPTMAGSILVLSDAGLLIAVLRRLKAEGLSFSSVKFIAHTPKVQAFVQSLGVESELVGYNQIQDWLKEDTSMKFDIIVGNPPYQGISEGATKDTTFTPKVWGKFVSKSFDLIAEGGYVSLVTPPGWMIPGSKLHCLIFDANRLLHVTSGIDGSKVFSASTTAAYFLVKAKCKKSETFSFEMHGHDDIVLENRGALPTMPCNPVAIGILAKTINSLGDRINLKKQKERPEVSDVQTTKFKFPNFVDRFKVQYTEHAVEDALKKKVIVWRLLRRNKACLVPRIEANDTHGLLNYFGGGHTHLLITREQTEDGITSYMTSKLVMFICSLFAQTAHAPVHIIQMLPNIMMNRRWTDAELYAHFGLTQEEIDLIEEIVK